MEDIDLKVGEYYRRSGKWKHDCTIVAINSEKIVFKYTDGKSDCMVSKEYFKNAFAPLGFVHKHFLQELKAI